MSWPPPSDSLGATQQRCLIPGPDRFMDRQRYDIFEVVEYENPCTGEISIATMEGQGHLILITDGAGGAHVNLVEAE
jgi:hypothetical protein